ncbi:MAG: hypothetical protein JOZ41_07505, partial [Chloroflexi bacterium]|nr:hypothetical protein [Chloroflexota bacterium]
MKASTWRRVRSSLVLVALALSLALVPQLTRSAPVRAQTASTTLTICGLVSGYTAAGPSATGAITIGGGTPFIIAANPTVAGAAAATL